MTLTLIPVEKGAVAGQAVTAEGYPITRNMLMLRNARIGGRSYTTTQYAARTLGITEAQYVDMENGRATLPDDEYAVAIGFIKMVQDR